jgi:Protein of unknown function (DUF3421)
VLVGTGEWIRGTGGTGGGTNYSNALPGNFSNQINFVITLRNNQLAGGETEDGELLFVGRVRHDGTVTIGKIQPSHKTCYIAYAGKELGFADYEILLA